jgi:hypothetical protein
MEVMQRRGAMRTAADDACEGAVCRHPFWTTIMRPLMHMSRSRWLLAVVLLLSGLTASAAPSTCVDTSAPCLRAVVAAGFDGDGRSDVAFADEVGGRQPRPDVRRAVSALGVVDLGRDGDHHPIAVSEHSRLSVWRNDNADHLSFQPPQPLSTQVTAAPRTAFDDGAAELSPNQRTDHRIAAGLLTTVGSVHTGDRAESLAFASAILPPGTTLVPESPRSPPLSRL